MTMSVATTSIKTCQTGPDGLRIESSRGWLTLTPYSAHSVRVRYSDGRPAPFHLIDGLPDAVVLSRKPSGKVETIKPEVISGFVLDGQFYTREESAKRLAELH